MDFSFFPSQLLGHLGQGPGQSAGGVSVLGLGIVSWGTLYGRSPVCPSVVVGWAGLQIGFVTEGASEGPVSSEEPSRFLSTHLNNPEAEALLHVGSCWQPRALAGTNEGGSWAGLAQPSSLGREKTWLRRCQPRDDRHMGLCVRVCPCPGLSAPSQGLLCIVSHTTRGTSRGRGFEPILYP